MDKTNENIIRNSDIDQLIENLLLEYIKNTTTVKQLVEQVYTPNFILELKKYVKDNTKRKEIFVRLNGIYQVLDYILSNAENIKSHNKVLLNLIAQNKWDTEVNAEYDFVNKKYIVKSNLRKILAQKNMTQMELANKTGISTATISNIINKPNTANVFNILKILYVLDIDILDLFTLEED